MKRIELLLLAICVIGLCSALKDGVVSEQRKQRILKSITESGKESPQDRELFFNPYMMSMAYPYMGMGMGMGMNRALPYSSMNPLYSMMMMNPMMSMMMNPMYSMMMNPMMSMMMMPWMIGGAGSMALSNPMMWGMMGGFGHNNQQNAANHNQNQPAKDAADGQRLV